MNEAGAVATRLHAVRARIEAACTRAGRDPSSVQLIAVSKGHDAERIAAAVLAGQRVFGESYVQELSRRARAFEALPDVRVRFIGHLQRNKVKDLLRLPCVHAVDSVSSIALAQALQREAAAQARTLEVLIQVNLDQEPQKAGVLPAEAPALIEALGTMPALRLRGLLAIPKPADDPEQMRHAFAALRALATRHGLPELSMGMSDDLEVAIEQGATMVRVGTAIFGERLPKEPA